MIGPVAAAAACLRQIGQGFGIQMPSLDVQWLLGKGCQRRLATFRAGRSGTGAATAILILAPGFGDQAKVTPPPSYLRVLYRSCARRAKWSLSRRCEQADVGCEYRCVGDMACQRRIHGKYGPTAMAWKSFGWENMETHSSLAQL